MKNIHILPTDKPSELYINMQGILSKSNSLLLRLKSRHIYITSDERIERGDWVFDAENEEHIYRASDVDLSNIRSLKSWYCKKIILTTDQDLIKDGVQAIDDEFLKWFINNSSCEWVEVEIICGVCGVEGREDEIDVCGRSKECARGWISDEYKIIIPKEEPKQICEYCKIEITKYGCGCGTKEPKQERMYSGEELKKYDSAGLKDPSNYVIEMPTHILSELEEQAKEMEKQQQDELAIEFAEWLTYNRESNYTKSIKELLEQFKNK